jgi:hypothetical protein
MLYATTYIFLLSFFWLLFMGLAVLQVMRQARLERQEAGTQTLSGKHAATKHFLAYLHSPLDEMQAWHHSKPSEKGERIPAGPLVLPLRYQHTLLFADDLGDTHPNPALSRAS